MRRFAVETAATAVVGALVLPVFILLHVDTRVAANVTMVAIAVLAWVFAVIYGARSNWPATEAGRSVLSAMLALALFATQVSISAWVSSSYPLRNEIRWVLYFGLAVTLVGLIRTVIREQSKD